MKLNAVIVTACASRLPEIDGKLQGLQKQLVPPIKSPILLEGAVWPANAAGAGQPAQTPVRRFRPLGCAGKGESKGDAGGERNIISAV